MRLADEMPAGDGRSRPSAHGSRVEPDVTALRPPAVGPTGGGVGRVRVLGRDDLPAALRRAARCARSRTCSSGSRIRGGRARGGAVSAARSGATSGTATLRSLCSRRAPTSSRSNADADAVGAPGPSSPAAERTVLPRSSGRRRRRSTLWRSCRSAGAPAGATVRDVRPRQPVMAIVGDPPDRARPPRAPGARAGALGHLLPRPRSRCSPRRSASRRSSGDPAGYRVYVRQLISTGRAFGLIRDGAVAVQGRPRLGGRRASPGAGRLADPKLRGRGWPAPAMAAVVRLARAMRPHGLVVRQRLQPAGPRHVPASLGVPDVGDFATILLLSGLGGDGPSSPAPSSGRVRPRSASREGPRHTARRWITWAGSPGGPARGGSRDRPSHVLAVPAHPARGPGGRRGAEPPAARAGRVHPAGRPGIFTWLPLGLRVLRNVERIVRDEMDPIGQELLFPALLPREPYDASGRWTEYGDNIFRLHDRKGADYLLGPTHEEMFTLGQGPLLVVQGPADLALPDPDKVPRRGPPSRRAAARARVRHEGLLLVRHRRRGPGEVLRRAPRRVREDLRPARLPLRHRAGHGRGDGRIEVRGVPRGRRERRGHLRALPELWVCRERRGRRVPVPAALPVDDLPAST